MAKWLREPSLAESGARVEHFVQLIQDVGRGKNGPKQSKQALVAALAPMVVCLGVLVFEGLAYNIVFLGQILPAVGKGAIARFLVPLFNLVWVLSVWSYLQALLADPGRVPRHWHEFVRSVGDALPIVAPRPEWQPGKATFCKSCLVPRPERAHHCFQCNACVLRMDHHCPWLNNCVGFTNHKFFLLTVMYSWLGTCVALATSLPEFVGCLMAAVGVQEDATWEEVNKVSSSNRIIFITFGIINVLVSLLLLQLVSVHWSFAIKNLTTIEDNYANMANPFVQDSAFGNLAQVFGAWGPDWLLPIQPLRPLSDGIYFQCSAKRLSETGTGLLEQVIADQETDDERLWEKRWEKRWHVRYHVPTDAVAGTKCEALASPCSPLSWFGCRGDSRRVFMV